MVFAALSLSCSSTRPATPMLPERFPNHTVDEIRGYLQAGLDTLHAYAAVSNTAVATPLGSAHFTARTRNRRHDSLRVDISIQFGIEAARILFTTDSIYVYDRIKNTVYYGDISMAGRLLPMPWMSPNLFLDVLGLPDAPIGVGWQVTADSLWYHLSDESGRVKLMVDPARWRIVRYEERTFAGSLVEEKSYLDFDFFDGVLLPTRIVVRRPADKVSATIQHRSIEINPTSLDLAFVVKPDATHVPIR